MNIPNNLVQIDANFGLDFFKKWFIYLKPLHGLTDREIDVIACFVKERYELSKIITDEGYLDRAVMNEDTKKKVREECNITLPHFQVIMSKLKKNKVIVNNRINPRFIPSYKRDADTFQLLFYFKLKSPDATEV